MKIDFNRKDKKIFVSEVNEDPGNHIAMGCVRSIEENDPEFKKYKDIWDRERKDEEKQ